MEALAEYEKAISKDPSVAVYFSNAATCQSRLGNNGEVLRLINEAIKLDPSFSKAYYRRGVCLMESRRFAEASEDFIRVCQEFPADVEAQKRLRECDRELDKKSSFEESLRAGFSSAIKVKRFELTRACLEELSVDASYTGPVVEYETPITSEWIRDTLIPHFAADKKLNIKYAYLVMSVNIYVSLYVFKLDYVCMYVCMYVQCRFCSRLKNVLQRKIPWWKCQLNLKKN